MDFIIDDEDIPWFKSQLLKQALETNSITVYLYLDMIDKSILHTYIGQSEPLFMCILKVCDGEPKTETYIYQTISNLNEESIIFGLKMWINTLWGDDIAPEIQLQWYEE